jgi:hypothetical protein
VVRDEFHQRLERIQVPLYNRTNGVVHPSGQRGSETRENSSSSIQLDEGSS